MNSLRDARSGRATSPGPARSPGAQTARQRAHAAMVEDIVAAAQAQLAEVGAAQLSMRAVARQVGVVSSAVFRYFPTRDALLTELILRGYNDLGLAAERAAAAVALHAGPGCLRRRFHAACDAARQWALANPHLWGLLYGTPVPGYHAPGDTKDPASRMVTVLADVYRDLVTGRATARAGGVSDGRGPHRSQPGSDARATASGPGSGAGAGGAAPAKPHIDAQAIGSARAFAGPMGDDDDIALVLMLWTWLNGVISAELWGHLVGSVDDCGEFVRAGVDYFADALGLPR